MFTTNAGSRRLRQHLVAKGGKTYCGRTITAEMPIQLHWSAAAPDYWCNNCVRVHKRGEARKRRRKEA